MIDLTLQDTRGEALTIHFRSFRVSCNSILLRYDESQLLVVAPPSSCTVGNSYAALEDIHLVDRHERFNNIGRELKREGGCKVRCFGFVRLGSSAEWHRCGLSVVEETPRVARGWKAARLLRNVMSFSVRERCDAKQARLVEANIPHAHRRRIITLSEPIAWCLDGFDERESCVRGRRFEGAFRMKQQATLTAPRHDLV